MRIDGRTNDDVREIEIKTKNSSKGRTACDYPLYLSRLKNFVKISDYTRFCVDTENAAV